MIIQYRYIKAAVLGLHSSKLNKHCQELVCNELVVPDDVLQCKSSLPKNTPQAPYFSRNSVTGNKKVEVEKGPNTHF